MAHRLFYNIGRIYGTFSHDLPVAGKDMAHIPFLENAWMEVKDGRIIRIGQGEMPVITDTVDCGNDWIFPGFCDSHTHLIFASWREREFEDKIQGLTYEQIAANGGGILNSAARLAQTSEEALFQSAWERLQDLIAYGTLAVEVKTGYGLLYDQEMKMLRVAARLKSFSPIPLRITLLAAHALPTAYRDQREDFIRMVCEKLIPDAAAEGLMDYVDVFCDQGFFTPDETARMLETALKFGYRGKIHANELGRTGGIQVGVQHDALSVDHLEHTGEEEIQALLQSRTIPTLLPGTAFFLRIPYPPARSMVDAGLPVAIASDVNPGSSPSGNPWFIWSLACIYLRLQPEEALTAMTRNAAAAMNLQQESGALAPGKNAHFIRVTAPPLTHTGDEKPARLLSYFPYRFAVNHRPKVYVGGVLWDEKRR